MTSGRFIPQGFIFDTTGPSIFDDQKYGLYFYVGLLNTKLCNVLVDLMNPTLHFTLKDANNFPLPLNADIEAIREVVKKLIYISKNDWDSYETSWDFTQNPVIRTGQTNLEQAFYTWQQQNSAAVAEMKHLEEENNKLFIDAYGLQDELTPEVPDEQITLTRADREKDSQRLVSYALGCMMGRYSLDEPGLI